MIFALTHLKFLETILILKYQKLQQVFLKSFTAKKFVKDLRRYDQHPCIYQHLKVFIFCFAVVY